MSAAGGCLRRLDGRGEAATMVRRSRFCGHSGPVVDGHEALASFLETVRAHDRDAGHVVYAWRGRDGASRSSDGGEPAGTGGRPLLAVLARAGLVDSAVAVARVFGGVLLGAAGLGRAYGEAAALAVSRAPVRTLRRFVVVSGRAAYPDQPALEAVLAGHVVDVRRTFGPEGVELAGEVPVATVEALARALAAATGGRATLAARGDAYWR